MGENGNDSTSTGAAGEKTFTQADVDRVVRDRLAREREKYADYDDLKARAEEADKSKTALDKLTEQVKGLQERTTKAEAAALRADVAQAKGLTAAQAKRLHGGTREELEADADELLSMFKPAGDKGAGESEGASKDDDKGGEGRKSPLSGRPKEKLTPGAVPATGDDVDSAKLAESILKPGF